MEGDVHVIPPIHLDKISTHALTWRATGYSQKTYDNMRNFYPRPHMEGDHLRGRLGGVLSDFYPRPHMEGDIVI